VKKIQRFPAFLGSCTLLAASAAIALAAAAQADPLAAPAAGLATVRITVADLEPDRLAIGSGQHVVFRNEADAMARVELDLPRGEGILCRSGRDEAARGRKFVVAGGDALECEAPAAAVRYRVFRIGGGGGSLVATDGELDPES
jgi:hypothetical protein